MGALGGPPPPGVLLLLDPSQSLGLGAPAAAACLTANLVLVGVGVALRCQLTCGCVPSRRFAWGARTCIVHVCFYLPTLHSPRMLGHLV